MYKKQIVSLVMAIVLATGLITGVARVNAASEHTHVVQEGDVLWRIAYAHEMTWEALAEYNGLENPHRIFPGQVLRIPAAQSDAYGIPDTMPQLPFVTENIIIGEGTDWPLGGYLTLPHQASASAPVPAVVLVHGDGPGDRNQAVFGYRPFYDIAAYLSANGVAVLRYDKRTLAHGPETAQAFGRGITVWEETIEDAILAADLLRADPRIGNVYMAGFSLGGMLAPRIHASGGDFDGIIIMAGSPRNPTDIIADQNLLGTEAYIAAQSQRVQALGELVLYLDTDDLWLEIDLDTLDYLADKYADIMREWFNLPQTTPDRDTIWYLIDWFIYENEHGEKWQYLYEAGNPDLLRYMLEVDPELDSQELYMIAIVNIAAGISEPFVAFLLDYIITSMQTEVETITAQLTAMVEAVPAQMAELQEFFASFAYMTDEEAKEIIVLEPAPGFYFFAYFFRDLMLHPAPYFLEQVTVPMLIMHGDNDFQVSTQADFNLYKELLAGRDNVTFRLYSGLNHFFAPSVATNMFEMLVEYEIPAQVDAEVLRDMLNWILGN